MGCKHKQKVVKIELLYPTFEFRERALIQLTCKNCNRFLLKLLYTRHDGSQYKATYGKQRGVDKYCELLGEIMCLYRTPKDFQPELDLDYTYFDGKDNSIRKINNNAIVGHYYDPKEVVSNLLILAALKGFCYTGIVNDENK